MPFTGKAACATCHHLRGEGARVAVVGTRIGETDAELHIAQPGGAVAKIPKADIARTEPMTVSLMPAGIDKTLTAEELRDLMTFLLTEVPASNAK